MQTVYPNYYKSFKCIADRCKHNCCIGWEIDIDADTAALYETAEGEIGDQIRASISNEGEVHFILGEGDRCPHLNSRNLCNIITRLGEDHLCNICRDHPRFRCELPGRVEVGLGLCCEAAGELIILQAEPVTFEFLGDSAGEDEIIALRDEVIALLQNREKTVPERISDMLACVEGDLPEHDMADWAEILLSLERLDEKWTDLLTRLKKAPSDISAFDAHMAERQTEYEQLLVYLIYRHFANAPDACEAAARAAFAALGYELIHALGAVQFAETGKFGRDDQVELCRLFSSELEYSEDNLYTLLDELY